MVAVPDAIAAQAPPESPLTAFAASLAAATESERPALLERHPDLVTPELVKSLIARGDASARRSEHDAALASFTAARLVATRIDDAKGLIDALNSAGGVLRQRAEYEPALAFHREALVRSRALGDQAWIAATANYIGNIHNARGEDAAAIEHYRQSLAASEALQMPRGVAATLSNLGTVFARQSDFTAAADHLARAEAVYASLDDQAGLAQVAHVTGFLRRSVGDYGGAIEQLTRALSIRERRGDRSGQAATLNVLGSVYRLQGDYASAVQLYERSLAIREALGEASGRADALHNLGLVFRTQGDEDRALEYIRRAAAIFRQIGSKANLATVLADEAAVLVGRREIEAALPLLQEALTLHASSPSPARRAAIRRELAGVQLARGDGAVAERTLREAIADSETAGDAIGLAAAWHQLGRLEQQEGRLEAAAGSLERAVDLARRLNDRERLWAALTSIGRLQRQRQRTDAARSALDEAIGVLEDLRDEVAGTALDEQRAFEPRSAPYVELIELVVESGRAIEALELAERSKARVLLSALQGRPPDPAGVLTVDDRARERQLRTALATANSRLAREASSDRVSPDTLVALRAAVDEARRAHADLLAAKYPSLRADAGKARTFTRLDLRAVARPRDTIVEYVVGDRHTLAFIVRARHPGAAAQDPIVDVVRLDVTREALRRRVRDFTRAIAARDLRVPAAAADLHAVLLGGVPRSPAPDARLVIVPDDVLWELPFQALRGDGGQYVAATSAVAYVQSLSVLAALEASQPPAGAARGVLAMGNPSLGTATVARTAAARRGALGPLPEAEREVEALARLYSGPSAVFVGSAAREDVLKREAGRHRVLHLATHGIVDDASPMYSHLLFAAGGDAGDDGLLEAWEILSMRLDADLVVMSACESARGRVAPGEGIVGLSWALGIAGARATVVSQWKVESGATAALMIAFHRELRKGAAKAEALRRASRQLLADERYRHPFYWAGFMLIGLPD
jgi:CHAT domain-containing protein/tetratricopeptide (TPR) repeat protein